MGYLRLFAFSMALSRTTPVVVSSVPPLTFFISSGRLLCIVPTTSAPSSRVISGL
jgi:hypothetical protein